MPNKIEKELSAEELEGFVKDLAAMPGLTLAKIQNAARERGIEISLMSASAFRDKNLAGYLQRIRGASESARLIAEAIQDGAEGSVLDGAAMMMSQQLMDAVMECDPDKIGDLTLAIARLRRSDQQERVTRLRVEKLESELKKIRAEATDILSADDTSEEEKAHLMRGLFGMC